MEQRHQRRARARRKHRLSFYERHHRGVKILAITMGTLVIATTGYAAVLNSKFSNVARLDTNQIQNRPDPDKGRSLNVLMLGSDKGKHVPGQVSGTSLAEDVHAKTWPTGRRRSDTIMMVHIPENRKHVYIVSIPRDTYTELYDATGAPYSKQKINAAFSAYGPNATIATVEHLTNVRMEHLAVIDFGGFRQLTRAVGGVEIYIPKSFYDPSQKVYWVQGKQTLRGVKALRYVRTRYGLPRSDFDRIARQQNFMRALMKKLLSKGTTRNPVRLTKTMTALTKHLVVDQGWDPADMRALALSLRNIQADDVTFLTAPVAGTGPVEGVGSVVRLDEIRSAQLFEAMAEDHMDDYVRDNPDDVLKSAKEVN